MNQGSEKNRFGGKTEWNNGEGLGAPGFDSSRLGGASLGSSTRDSFAIALIFFIFIAIIRMVVLVEPALVDPSEGRFASAALQMLQSGDWITPKIHDYGAGWVPYLAKPPLHIWLVASSLWLFGVNEFAARFPSLLALLGTAGTIFWVTKLLYGRSQGVVSLTIFFSTIGLWLFAPVCLTDATLMFCVTASLSSLALIWSGDSRRWIGYMFFLAIAAGLMVKGPVALVFIGLPIFFAVLWQRDIVWMKKLPWLGGVLLILACNLPWYLECEARNPGFLRYFLIEEHIQRFLKPHTEVRYGAVHTEPRGTILVYAFGVLLPWSLFFLWGLFRGRLRRELAGAFRSNGAEVLFLAWAISPILFFVFARSILPTYVYPTVPAWALCLGLVFSRAEGWRNVVAGPSYLQRIGLVFIGLALAIYFLLGAMDGLNRLYLAGIISVGVVFAFAWRQLEGKMHSSLIRFMTSTMFAISVAILGLGERISFTRSTRAAIDHFYHENSRSRAPIVVLYHDPRSIHFYVAKIMKNSARVFSGNSVEALQEWRAARVMVKTSDQKRLSDLEVTGLELDRCVGSWCLYRWKRPKQRSKA